MQLSFRIAFEGIVFAGVCASFDYTEVYSKEVDICV